MQTIIRLSRKNLRGIWIVFTVVFLLWLGLLLMSDVSAFDLRLSILLLGLLCFGLPVIGTFCIFVMIDETRLTVPMAIVLRRSIPIKDIRELTLQRYGLGLLQGIIVDYVDGQKRMVSARLPSISTFGRSNTIEMLELLTRANPMIRIDPEIARILSSSLQTTNNSKK